MARDEKATPQERAEATTLTDDYMIAMFVRAWHLGAPVPSANIERVRELPGADFDVLIQKLTHTDLLQPGVPKDPNDPEKGWLVEPVTTRSLLDQVFAEFSVSPDMSSPFLAAGAASLEARGQADRRDDPTAGAGADVHAGEADRLVTG